MKSCYTLEDIRRVLCGLCETIIVEFCEGYSVDVEKGKINKKRYNETVNLLLDELDKMTRSLELQFENKYE